MAEIFHVADHPLPYDLWATGDQQATEQRATWRNNVLRNKARLWNMENLAAIDEMHAKKDLTEITYCGNIPETFTAELDE